MKIRSERGRRTVWAAAAIGLAAAACNLGAKKAGPSARDDCARVAAVTDAEHKKLPSADQLGTTRAEVNAAKAVRDYASKLDAVPVNDKELNNKLADYGDHLRKMAKALDELWTARDSEKASYAAKAQKVFTEEYAFVNEINAYCQGAR
ncbi:MAG: hypothetical protein U0414_31685 [Polyangiaceae bacterium]